MRTALEIVGFYVLLILGTLLFYALPSLGPVGATAFLAIGVLLSLPLLY